MSEYPKSIQPMTPTIKDPRKCPAHNYWMRKGQCELCRMAQDKKQKELEQITGSNKPPVKIGKL